MRRYVAFSVIFALILLLTGVSQPVLAQEGEPQASAPELTVFSRYPSQVTELGKNVTFPLEVQTGQAQIVHLSLEGLPEGWTATFRSGSRVIQAVYAVPDDKNNVDLRLEPPDGASAGVYSVTVVAEGETNTVRFPLELTIKDKLPPSLRWDIDLPTLRGTPNSTFSYSATLRNQGDEEVTVSLTANTPPGFLVKFKSAGKEVTSIPVDANGSARLTIEVKPFEQVEAGSYAVNVVAQGGDASASLELTAEVTGQPTLSITTPDGRLSAQAYVGKESPLKILLRNTGTAAAHGIELNATEPSGWTVSFNPKTIDELPAGEQKEVEVSVRPADKAVAGDYMVTIRATPDEGGSKSAEFRITVLTSTLWGVAGIGLIAIAVAVVALAVMQFGRR